MILKEEVKEESLLGDFLREKFSLSSRIITDLKRSRGIFVGKKRRHLDYRLTPGEVVKVYLTYEENTFEAVPMELSIIYEDEGLLVLNKPSGISVHPSGGSTFTTLLHGVSYLQKIRDENYKIRFCNRLDRDTSGVIILAKNKYMHHQMSEIFIHHAVEKVYYCLVHGVLNEAVTVDKKIHMAEDGIHREVSDEGKESITHFKPIEKGRDWCLIEARPVTGRTHQIRVHLKSLGHSIFGDNLYGIEDDAPRMFLHCLDTKTKHPLTKQEIHFHAPLPKEFETLIETLKMKEKQ